MNAKNALVQLGVQSADGRVDVYRDHNVVTVVAHGAATRKMAHGNVRTNGLVTHQYDAIEDFEQDRKDLLERYPLAYVAIVNRLGIQDDVRNAPRLPAYMRHLLPKRLPPGMTQEMVDAEEARLVQVSSNGPIDITLGVAADPHIADAVPAREVGSPGKKPSLLALLTAGK